jgi:hypothetical protein
MKSQRISNELTAIAEHAKINKQGPGGVIVDVANEVSYRLSNEYRDRFDQLVSQFVKHADWSDKFSEMFLTNKLRGVFASIIKHGESNAGKAVEGLLRELELYNTEETIYLYVVGIDMDEEFSLGNITLLRGTEESLKGRPADRLMGHDKDGLVGQILEKRMATDFWDASLSEYKVIAEPQRAFERARDETRRALEILRYASKSLYPLQEELRIGLEDEQGYDARTAFIVSADRITVRPDRDRPKRLKIDAELRKKLAESGAYVLGNILKKKSATEYEEVLLRAVHWFSAALLETELENSFLFMIISLETLFTPKDRDPISTAIAESVALIFADELAKRKEIKATIKKYYAMRSGISHGGKKNVMESQYFRLMEIVLTIISKLTSRTADFSDRSALLQWIEDLKLD